MSTYNNRVRALSKKRQLALIRAWDYVDGATHCINLKDNTIEVHTWNYLADNDNSFSEITDIGEIYGTSDPYIEE